MRILCFGDSNTYGYDPRSFLGGRYPPQFRWVDILAEKTGHEIVNGGENGREIPRRPGEVSRFLDLLSRTQAEQVTLLLGGNDLLQGAGADEVGARMERFVTQIPLPAERILLIAPPPVTWGAWVTEERLLTDSLRLSEIYKEVAHRSGIAYANAGEWGVTLTFDGVHFDEQGHLAFARKLFELLGKAENKG